MIVSRLRTPARPVLVSGKYERKWKVRSGKSGDATRKRVIEMERLNVHREVFQEKRLSRQAAIWLQGIHLRAWLRASSPGTLAAQE